MMKNPLVAFAAAIIFGLLGAYLLWSQMVSPERQRLATATAKSEELNKKLDQAKAAERKYNELQKQIVESTGQLEKLKALLPVEENLGSLLSNLGRVAQESNLRIIRLEPSVKLSERGFFNQREFKMAIEGGYHDVATYFDKVGRFRRIITIRSPQMKRTGSGGGLGGRRILVEFSAYTYLQKPMEAPPQPAAAGKPAR